MRNRHVTESWREGAGRGPGEGCLISFPSHSLKYAKCFSTTDMKTAQKMENKNRSLCLWQLRGAASPHTSANMFEYSVTWSWIYSWPDHSSHHNGTLNCVISLIQNFPVKHIVIVFLPIRNVPLTHFLGEKKKKKHKKCSPLSLLLLLFEKKNTKIFKKWKNKC